MYTTELVRKCRCCLSSVYVLDLELGHVQLRDFHYFLPLLLISFLQLIVHLVSMLQSYSRTLREFQTAAHGSAICVLGRMCSTVVVASSPAKAKGIMEAERVGKPFVLKDSDGAD